MMQRCSSSRSSSHRSQVVGHCPCGLFHAPGSSLCLLFGGGGDVGEGHFGSSSGVDCTLSLSTPSSRSTANDRSSSRSGGRISNLCWDIFHPKQQPAVVGRGAGEGGGAGAVQVHHLGGEALLARRCANCDTTSTPLWRNGPRGPKSLCNACGIRYKKEERRASSTAADVGQHHHHPHSYPWAYAAAAQAAHKASPAEFRLIQGDDDGASSAVPFLPWRLNTPGLLHDYT